MSGVDCDYYEGFHPHYFVFCGYILLRNVACYKGPWVPVIIVGLFLECRLPEGMNFCIQVNKTYYRDDLEAVIAFKVKSFVNFKFIKYSPKNDNPFF